MQSFKEIAINSKIQVDSYLDNINYVLTQGKSYPPAHHIKILKTFKTDRTQHLGKRSLYTHLLGTYRILKKWNISDEICLAGLYHSIYSTDGYRKSVLKLEQRNIIQEVIGAFAEKLVYYFCCEDRNHFPSNLNLVDNFTLKDRFQKHEIPLSQGEFTALITIHLADHLEQLPFTHDYRCQDFYQKSQPFLKEIAFDDFIEAYRVKV